MALRPDVLGFNLTYELRFFHDVRFVDVTGHPGGAEALADSKLIVRFVILVCFALSLGRLLKMLKVQLLFI